MQNFWSTITTEVSKIDLSYQNIQDTFEGTTGLKVDQIIDQASDYAETVTETIKNTTADDVYAVAHEQW
mgnify:CR=1 FL=1